MYAEHNGSGKFASVYSVRLSTQLCELQNRVLGMKCMCNFVRVRDSVTFSICRMDSARLTFFICSI